ncbi:MAG: hypothetical protein JRN68_05675 [Nitrososphaerota archaeon]|nr:hypothetical protein [Nitrososphaerota archaeon]
MVKFIRAMREKNGFREKWMTLDELARLDKAIRSQLEIVKVGDTHYSKKWVKVRILNDDLADYL